jgi:hypothetical protein
MCKARPRTYSLNHHRLDTTLFHFFRDLIGSILAAHVVDGYVSTFSRELFAYQSS